LISWVSFKPNFFAKKLHIREGLHILAASAAIQSANS
jgi:hypothetical protein